MELESLKNFAKFLSIFLLDYRFELFHVKCYLHFSRINRHIVQIPGLTVSFELQMTLTN